VWPQGRATLPPDPLPSVALDRADESGCHGKPAQQRGPGASARSTIIGTSEDDAESRSEKVDWVHVARQGRKRSTRRILVSVVVAVVVVAAAVGGWWYVHRPAPAEAAVSSQLVAATTQTVKETVSATGTIEPANQANLKFAQAGKVTAVNVKVGDTVTAGQPLGAIDATALTAALTLAQQQLAAAQAQLAAATTADNSQQIASANAQVTSAQTKVTSAQSALDQATLSSTIAGTVAAVNVNVGDTVTGGTSTSGSSASGSSGVAGSSGSGGGAGSGGSGSGGSAGGSGSGGSGAAAGSSAASSASTAQFVVIATDSWVVNAGVGASDLPKLKNGLQATITPTDATQPIFGTVSTVGVIGTTSGGTSTFPVTIAVTGTPSGLYAGTTANVLITVKQVPNVLTVPTAAIHEEGGQTVVYQMKDGQQVSTPVSVGAVYGATTQITKGISDGDEVVVTGRTTRVPSGTSTGGVGGGRNGTGGFGGFGGGQNGGGQNGGGFVRQGAPAGSGGSR
jgi:membrane fusion protein, macrolide-specific efflux system